jgi:hypothetical protein
MRPGKDGGSLTGADGTLTSGATGGQGIILDPLSRSDRERAGAAAQAGVARLRAAILEHKAAIEAAGPIHVADDVSRARAVVKRGADERLWALAENRRAEEDRCRTS